MRKLSLLIVVALLSLGLLPFARAQEESEPFTLTVMHTNDTRSSNLPNGDGDGGVARQAAVVTQIREEVPNTILLDTGDRFMGTLYYTLYLGQDQAQIMNAMGYSAMTLGNHEFDNGDDVLASFIEQLEFPVVASNLDVSQSAYLEGDVLPYTILEVGEQQIGVIGLTLDNTPEISSPEPELVFNGDYLEVANSTAAELADQGVNKIILLAHLGFNVVNPLIPEFENIDLIVDGNTHTLLSNTLQDADGTYPLEYTGATGDPILYVQSGDNNIYLGRLDLEFDDNGIITDFGGDSIFISRYITPDKEMQGIMDELTAPVESLLEESIGATTEVFLNGDRAYCRVEECNFGDVLADAIRADTGAQIAFMNGGGIRANIEAGDITLGEVLTAQPFGNLISTFDIKGVDVLAALENSVSLLTFNEDGLISRADPDGRFLQVSGLRYSIDPTQEVGKRIVNVEVLGKSGEFVPLDLVATYSAASINFLRRGGDDYSVLRDNAIDPYDFGKVDYEVLRQYLIDNTPITQEVEGRITYVNAELEPAE